MFNIIKNRKIFYIISAVIILIGIVMAFVNGFNEDVDFAGGTTMYVNIGREYDNQELTSVAEESLGMKVSSVQKSGDNGYEAIIKTKELTQDQRTKLFEDIQAHYQLQDTDLLSVDSVGATVGQDLKRNALISALIAAALMLVYISIRFEILSGCAAVLALIHDVLIMLSVYTIFNIPINTSFIAAMLTILGYSINATIVLFDRVRENMKISRKVPFETIMNDSIWQTMGRSINTTITTLVTIVILFFLGVPSIKEFAFPIIIGVLSGAYSSIFLAGNFWCLFKKLRKDKNVTA